MTESDTTRPRVLVAIPREFRDRLFTPATWARLTDAADVVLSPSEGALESPAVDALLGATDVLLTGWGSGASSPDWVDRAPRLKAVIHAAGSVRWFMDERVFARGILVSSQAEENGRPVAEYTVAMILLAAKSVFRVEREFRLSRAAYPLDTFTGGGFGTPVGIIGASRIGRRVLRLLRSFDLDVRVHDPFLSERDARSLGVRLVGLDELFERSAVVSLHAPLLESTRGMIGRRHFERMPDHAVFINTARGALVDQDALITEVATGRIDAVIDVTDPEVLPPDSPLWDLPNVILTPHMAGSVGNEVPRLGRGAVDEVVRFASGEPLRHRIDEQAFPFSA
ncbi:hydroxyacid dehydrogenase [Streptomyces sp. NPDC058357]|uniref:hydroxyacid dehydrogenase n=1 Tax=unclassified Streptomyces TaxID=2593676 RepID=UPI0036515B62